MAKYLPFFLLVLLIPDVYLQDVYRLPTNVVPVSYIVDFNINPDVFTGEGTTYSGATNIRLLVHSSTNEIKLHLNTQYITLLSNFTINGNTVANHAIDETTETVTITTPSALDPGTYNLYVTYNGRVSTTDMYGVYRSSYVNATGAIKYLITTQFQPTYARRAFPCFDEPAFKATFQLRFITDNSQTILTNTKRQTAVGDQQQIFHFTPIMSTYLVAFTVSEFTCDDPVLVDGVENRICSKNESSAERAWANEKAPQILESMNLYTNVNYNTTIDKIDQVAIPDFAAGAMENWGMNTYREQFLLYNENESSNMDKQFVATILAHEIAHQWFGNLVTAEWWSELFLNEGFADYFEYFATHKVLPEWQMDRQYVIDTVQRALRADEGSALPLQHNVSSPTEILLMFNVISYSKGGSIFRMLEHVINSTNWEAGLTNYLRAKANGNAVPEDLWSILQNQITSDNTFLPQGVTLNQVMENWVKQSGFPLLTVTNNNGTVTINQTQFSANENLTQVWYVPISYTTSVDTNKFQSTTPQVWLPATNESITFNLSAGAQWIILNNLQTGFYRVNYDANSWDAIELALKATNFSDIDELNRAGIVDDLFSLAKINKIAYSRIFKLLEFLKEDRSYFSWYPAFTGFNFLIDRFGLRSELGTKIAVHLLELMTPLYESTPFSSINETDQIYTLKQSLALRWACLLGHTDCITNSTALFAAYKANVNNRTNKNLRSTVYCTALKESTDNTDWDFLWNVYNTSNLASEKSLLLSTLSCSKDPVILQRFLNLSLTDESIRSQDRYTIFQNVVNNPDGINIARQFFMDRHAEIVEKYQTLTVISNILELLASKVTNQQEFTDLATFINSGSLSADQVEEGKRALVTAQKNVQWLQEYENDIRSYYEQQNPASTNATEPTIPGGSTNATDPTTPGAITNATEPTNPGGSTNATEPTTPGGSTNATEPTNPDASTTPSTTGSSAVASYKFGLIVSLLYILYSFN